MYDIIVIGAGFSGAYAALELVKDNHNILILEGGSGAISDCSTSYNQCYKLHSGAHYFGDAITARKCLIDSVNCARQWNGFLLGEQNSLPRRNRHYIMSNSLFDVSEVKKVMTLLSQTYMNLVQEDSRNKVFGDPKEFIKEVAPHQYNYVAQDINFVKHNGVKEKAHIALAIDVGEPQIDIQRMQKHLHYKITHTNNITSKFNCEVINISPCKGNLGYIVTAFEKNKYGESKIVDFKTKRIVNCAWQNIEDLNKTMGFCEQSSDKVLIRMKISLLARLPQSLENMDTCIFSIGPYCSITNQYDGTAVLTYEPVTNVGHYFSGEQPPEEVQNIQKQKGDLLETEVGKKIAKKIIDGCAIYVPDLKNSLLLEVRVGYVKMYVNQDENYSIYHKDSPIHKRREHGVIVHNNDLSSKYISASGIKMTYTQDNAEKIRDFVRKGGNANLSIQDLDCIKERQDFILETKATYKQANNEENLLKPTLLKDPITSEFYIPD